MLMPASAKQRSFLHSPAAERIIDSKGLYSYEGRDAERPTGADRLSV